MNVGDKVLCKQTYMVETIYGTPSGKKIAFLEGAYYEIVDMDNFTYTIYSIITDLKLIFTYRFDLYSNYRPNFNKWFITEREIRKQKLEKLNKIL